MLIAGHPDAREEVAAEDLHVAGEHEQLGAAREQLEHPLLRGRLVVLGAPARGGRASRPRPPPRSRSGWLEITATISASSSPRRQRQSRSSRQWSWRETRIADALALAPPAQLPVHAERLADLAREAPPEASVALVARRQEELGAHEEAPAARVRGVLVRGDDVGAALEQEARHGGDDAGLVGAGDQQARGVLRLARSSPRRPVRPRLAARIGPAGHALRPISRSSSCRSTSCPPARESVGAIDVYDPFGRLLQLVDLAVGRGREDLAAVGVLLDFGQFLLHPRAAPPPARA